MTEKTDQSGITDDAEHQGVGIQKIYLKDSSYESPESPKVFSMEDWAPKLNLQVDTMVRPGANDRFEVILKITVEAKQGDMIAFLCEVQQAGVFLLQGYEGEAQQQILGVYCPSMLFPYAREQVSSLVSKGGFPALMLQPLNFEGMYEQERKNQAAAG
jgi:preprotein translocase subunit SecB